MFLPHPRVKVSIVGSLRDREVACSASDRKGSNFKSCVWRTVASQSSHHPQEVLLAQFSLHVYKGGLKPDSFHFILLVHSDCTSLKSCKNCDFAFYMHFTLHVLCVILVCIICLLHIGQLNVSEYFFLNMRGHSLRPAYFAPLFKKILYTPLMLA